MHIFFNMFAVKSRISLRRIETNSPFLQLILCWKSCFEPYAHVAGKLLNGQPYRILIPSQNCCLFKSKPHFLMEMHLTNLKHLSRGLFGLIVFVLRLNSLRLHLACFYKGALFHILFYYFLQVWNTNIIWQILIVNW